MFIGNKSCASNPVSFLDNITSKWASTVMHDFSRMVANNILIHRLRESTLKWTTVMRLQVLSLNLQRMNSTVWVSGKKKWGMGCCTVLWMELPDIFTNDSSWEPVCIKHQPRKFCRHKWQEQNSQWSEICKVLSDWKWDSRRTSKKSSMLWQKLCEHGMRSNTRSMEWITAPASSITPLWGHQGQECGLEGVWRGPPALPGADHRHVSFWTSPFREDMDQLKRAQRKLTKVRSAKMWPAQKDWGNW